jgi:hypothetical protein
MSGHSAAPEPPERSSVGGAHVRDWGPRRWSAAVAGSIGIGLLVGLPTELIPNPFFVRMMPAEWWNVPVWLVTSVLAGLLLATYVREGAPPEVDAASRRGGIGGVLTFFAVGCPVCNKLVVLALGTSGAMSWFAPLQPVLAVVAIALLATALRGRLRGQQACAVVQADVAVAADR